MFRPTTTQKDKDLQKDQRISLSTESTAGCSKEGSIYKTYCDETNSRIPLDLVHIVHEVPHPHRSAASRAGVPLMTILRTGGWSSEQTLAKHYCVPTQHKNSFAEAIYNNNNNNNNNNKFSTYIAHSKACLDGLYNKEKY